MSDWAETELSGVYWRRKEMPDSWFWDCLEYTGEEGMPYWPEMELELPDWLVLGLFGMH